MDEYVDSGTIAQLQNAVNAVSVGGGGNVRISGVFDYNNETVTVPGGVSVIGNPSNTFVRQFAPAPFNTMFQLVRGNGNLARISGFELNGQFTGTNDDVGGTGIIATDAKYRVDNMRLIDFPQAAVGVNGYSGCKGVIDHNYIAPLYKEVYGGLWGYGVLMSCNDYWDWDDDITHFLGKYETIPDLFPVAYIEDNTFYHTRHAVATNQLAWYCFRHNTVQQDWNTCVDVHGSSVDRAGGRGGEVYQNTLSGQGIGVGFRGGSGAIWGNTINCSGGGIYISKDNPGTLLRPLNDLWIWGNNVPATSDGNYIQDVDYFLREPTMAQDGFTYIPYPYPHPLVGAPTETTPRVKSLGAGSYRVGVQPTVSLGGKNYKLVGWQES